MGTVPTRSTEQRHQPAANNDDANEHQDEDQHNGRDVDAAHVRKHAPDRAQERFGDAIEEIPERPHKLIVGVDDIEGDKPAQNGAADNDPDEEIDQVLVDEV